MNGLDGAQSDTQILLAKLQEKQETLIKNFQNTLMLKTENFPLIRKNMQKKKNIININININISVFCYEYKTP